MTEQQEHLQQLISQQQSLIAEIQGMNQQISDKREVFLRVQGAIEYLQQTGVVLPEPEAIEESAEGETVEE